MPAFSDLQFKIAVGALGAILVAGLSTLRFCGDVSIAAKPPMPTVRGENARELLNNASQTKSGWGGYLQSDSKEAGVEAPTEQAMSQAFVYQEASTAKELSVGDELQLAGLALQVVVHGENTSISAKILGTSTVAYHFEFATTTSSYVCDSMVPHAHNTLVIPAGATEIIPICTHRDGVKVTFKVETMQLPPLSVYYVTSVAPQSVGVPDKLAKVHTITKPALYGCSALVASAVKGGLAKGKIRWRDLIDFYARHRCATYSFPLSYRMFTKDSERPLPQSN